MTNAASTALAALGGIKGAIAKVQQTAPRGAGGEPFMKMDNHGTWMYGQENVEVEDGSKWAFSPIDITHGWVCWKAKPQGSKEASEKLGEIVVPLNGDLPAEATLPDYGMNGNLKNEWNYFVAFHMKCISGEDEGEQALYNPSSKGGVDALLGRDRRSGLLGAIGEQLDKDPAHPVPVCTLGKSSYVHPTHKNKVFTPVLEIVDWLSLEGVTGGAPAAEPEKKPEPAQTTRRQTKPAPVQEQVEDEDEQEELTVAHDPAAIAAAAAAASGGGEGVRRRRRAA
jgi:hypothetical protein